MLKLDFFKHVLELEISYMRREHFACTYIYIKKKKLFTT